MFNLDNPFGSGLGESHPQFNLIKKHIERSVQDLFLISLRNQPMEMVHIFTEEDQIEKFKNRMLSYWEFFEEYEICQEITDRIEALKIEWRVRDSSIDPLTLEKIKALFE
jgi:hypothetical protein